MAFDRYSISEPRATAGKPPVSKCPCCSGRGTVIDKKTHKERTCLICNGSGQIKNMTRQMQ